MSDSKTERLAIRYQKLVAELAQLGTASKGSPGPYCTQKSRRRSARGVPLAAWATTRSS